MAGTVKGGKAGAKTNKTKYGADFYAIAGAKGGRAKVAKGFSMDRKLASKMGRIGGLKSRRWKR